MYEDKTNTWGIVAIVVVIGLMAWAYYTFGIGGAHEVKIETLPPTEETAPVTEVPVEPSPVTEMPLPERQ